MVGLALLLSVLAIDDLTPEKAAAVQRDREKAMADVAKKFGNKKSSELSPGERREMIHDQRAAESVVLEKHRVDAKELARYEAKMNLTDRAATKQEKERLEKKEANEKAAAEKSDVPQEVQIQRGFSDDHPVVLEEKAGDSVVVEKSLPPDAIDDQNAASGSTPQAEPQPESKPKKKGKK